MPGPCLKFHGHCYLQVIYGCILIFSGFILIFRVFISSFLTIRASSRLHHRLITKILKCPMSFFDRTPVGRLLNRFGIWSFRISFLFHPIICSSRAIQHYNKTYSTTRQYSKYSASLRNFAFAFFQALFLQLVLCH